jgi:hypothetical protein
VSTPFKLNPCAAPEPAAEGSFTPLRDRHAAKLPSACLNCALLAVELERSGRTGAERAVAGRPWLEAPDDAGVEPADGELAVVGAVPLAVVVAGLPAASEDALDPPPHDASPSPSSNRAPADRRSRKNMSRSLLRA